MTDEILAGDVAIDLSQGTPLQVVSQSAKTVDEHRHTRDDQSAEMFGADPDDPVYNCVFLPTPDDQITPPKRTYAYPESRLLRFPTEEAATTARLQTELRGRTLRMLTEAADPDLRDDVLELVGEVFDDRGGRASRGAGRSGRPRGR